LHAGNTQAVLGRNSHIYRVKKMLIEITIFLHGDYDFLFPTWRLRLHLSMTEERVLEYRQDISNRISLECLERRDSAFRNHIIDSCKNSRNLFLQRTRLNEIEMNGRGILYRMHFREMLQRHFAKIRIIRISMLATIDIRAHTASFPKWLPRNTRNHTENDRCHPPFVGRRYDHPAKNKCIRDNACSISFREQFENCLYDTTLILIQTATQPAARNCSNDAGDQLARNQESRYMISRVRESRDLIIIDRGYTVMRYRIAQFARYAIGDVQKVVCMRASEGGSMRDAM